MLAAVRARCPRRLTSGDPCGSVAFHRRMTTEWALPEWTPRLVERCDGRSSIAELRDALGDARVLEVAELLMSPEIERLAPTNDRRA